MGRSAATVPALRRSLLLPTAAAVAFLVLTLLVAAGAARRADQFAVSHAMPWLAPGSSRTRLSDLTLPPVNHSLGETLVALWTYPAAFVPSLLIVACGALVLYRRGRTRLAIGLLAAWLVGNAMEGLGKAGVTRPALYQGSVHIAGFDDSFPSGHALRAFVLAAALAYAWPRLTRYLVAWVLGVAVALVVLGDHAPSDVVGGLLVALALVAGADALGRQSLSADS